MFSRRLVLRSVAALLVAAALFYAVRTRRDFWDFEVYRRAGIRALAAEPLYRTDDGHYQFKYWPAFALAMMPMAFIPDVPAKFLWFCLSIGLLGIYFRRALALLPDRRCRTGWLIAWSALLTGKFVVKELVNGQTNILMALLVVLAIAAVDRGRSRLAGVLVALAVFVKPYALLLVPWIAVAAGMTALASALLGILAGLLMPAILYGWTGNLSLLAAWYATVTQTTAPNLVIADNMSVAAMWAKWLGSGSVASVLTIGTAIGALILGLFSLRRRRRVSRPAYLEAGLLLLLMPLLSPQGWDYVLLIALPAFLCLLDRFRDASMPWQATTALGFALASLTIFDLLGRRLYLALMDISAVSIGAVLLVVSLAHLRQRGLA